MRLLCIGVSWEINLAGDSKSLFVTMKIEKGAVLSGLGYRSQRC